MLNFTTAEKLNSLHKEIATKLPPKKALKYIKEVERLFNPNTTNIVEYRINGVVTKDGDSYIFHALMDLDFEQWRISFSRTINEQY